MREREKVLTKRSRNLETPSLCAIQSTVQYEGICQRANSPPSPTTRQRPFHAHRILFLNTTLPTQVSSQSRIIQQPTPQTFLPNIAPFPLTPRQTSFPQIQPRKRQLSPARPAPGPTGAAPQATRWTRSAGADQAGFSDHRRHRHLPSWPAAGAAAAARQTRRPPPCPCPWRGCRSAGRPR